MSENVRDIRSYANGTLDENCKFLGTDAQSDVKNFQSTSMLTFPPYTTAERLALTPFEGRTAYDTDLSRAFIYEDGKWQTFLTSIDTRYDEDATGATLNLGAKQFKFAQNAPGATGIGFPELDATPAAPAGNGYLGINTFKDVLMFSGTDFVGGGNKWKGLTFVDSGNAIPDGNFATIKENHAGTDNAYAAELIDSGLSPADMVTFSPEGGVRFQTKTLAEIHAIASPQNGDMFWCPDVIDLVYYKDTDGWYGIWEFVPPPGP